MTDFSEYKGIWVFCEQRGGELMPTDFELVSEARRLANEMDCKVTGVLLGEGVEEAAGILGGYGADEVMVCEDPLLKVYTTDAYTKVLCDLVDEYKPAVLLMGATNIGRDLGPRCAARLHTGLTADATHLDVDTKEYIEFLKSLGDRVKCAAEGDILHVRIQTNDPGLIIQRSQKFGELGEVRLINLKEAESGRSAVSDKDDSKAEPAAPAKPEPQEVPPQPRKEVGFITVSVGEGIKEIFTGLGVDYVISGGQTMNPSTDDVLQAVEKVNADTIFVLPNNKNIVMAANQAASLTTDKKVVVVPTTTVPQGITAVINYMPDLDAEANKANMTEEIGTVHSAEVTYAVRDTEIDGIRIHEGDIMAIGDSGILTTGKGIEDVTFESLKKIVEDDTEIISIYYGKDVSEEDAEKLRDRAAEAFTSCDVELQYGGQPIYYYILSAE